jgi:hypothetical protein
MSSDLSVALTLNSTSAGIATLATSTLTISAATNANSSDTISTPTAPGTYTVSASATAITATTSGVVTVTLPSITGTSGSANVGAGTYASSPNYIFLSNPAPAGGVTFTLTVSIPASASTTGTITVPAGTQSWIPFNITGLAVGSPTVTFSAPGWQDYVYQLQVVQPTFSISGLATSQSTTGTGSTFTVQVYTPGCGTGCDYVSGNTTVTFSVSGTPSNIVAAPASVVILAGTSQVAGSVAAPTTTGTYNLVLTALGFTTYTSPAVTVAS